MHFSCRLLSVSLWGFYKIALHYIALCILIQKLFKYQDCLLSLYVWNCVCVCVCIQFNYTDITFQTNQIITSHIYFSLGGGGGFKCGSNIPKFLFYSVEDGIPDSNIITHSVERLNMFNYILYYHHGKISYLYCRKPTLLWKKQCYVFLSIHSRVRVTYVDSY